MRLRQFRAVLWLIILVGACDPTHLSAAAGGAGWYLVVQDATDHGRYHTRVKNAQQQRGGKLLFSFCVFGKPARVGHKQASKHTNLTRSVQQPLLDCVRIYTPDIAHLRTAYTWYRDRYELCCILVLSISIVPLSKNVEIIGSLQL